MLHYHKVVIICRVCVIKHHFRLSKMLLFYSYIWKQGDMFRLLI